MHTPGEQRALNEMLDAVDGMVRTLIELGAEPQVRQRFARLIETSVDPLEMSRVLTALKTVEQRRHSREEFDQISNAKQIVTKLMGK